MFDGPSHRDGVRIDDPSTWNLWKLTHDPDIVLIGVVASILVAGVLAVFWITRKPRQK